MECNIKIVKLKQVLPPGTFPKREHNVRFFYHRTDGCYYMYDEKGCEINLTTDGNIIAIDRELIVGSESLSDDSLVCIGLKANYVRPSKNSNLPGCQCQDTYIRAWTYIKDLQDFLQTGDIERDSYRVSVTASPDEWGVVSVSGTTAIPDEDPDNFRFRFTAGSKVTLHAIPTKGYHFVGWKERHTNEIFSITSNWSFIIKRDMDLIGVFEKDVVITDFYINVNASPVDKGYVSGAGSFKVNSKRTITAAPVAGYHFKEWRDSSNRVVSTDLQYDFTVTKDETYTAYFEENPQLPNKYELTIVSNPHDKGAATGAGIYDEGATAIIVPIPVDGWEVKSVVSSDGTVTAVEDGTYSMVINKNSTVIINYRESLENSSFKIVAGRGGKVRWKRSDSDTWSSWGESFSVQAIENTLIDLDAKIDTDFTFDGWYTPTGQKLPLPQNTIIIEKGTNHKVYAANFVQAYIPPKQPTIKVKSDGINQIQYRTASPTTNQFGEWSEPITGEASFTVPIGYDFEVQALPNSNYEFANWTFDGGIATDVVYNGTSTDALDGFVLQAVFTRIYYYKLYVIAQENGKCRVKQNGVWGEFVAGRQTITNLRQGARLEVEAKGDTGYHFLHWTDDSDSSNPREVIIPNNDTTIQARFEQDAPKEYTVTTLVNPANTATVTGAGTYTDGQSCTITATAKQHYRITSVTVNGATATLNNNRYTFVVEQNTEVIVSTQLIRYDVTFRAETGGSVAEVDRPDNWRDSISTQCTNGTKIAMKAKANAGYEFLGWYKDSTRITTETTYEFTISGATVYVAKFRKVQRKITLYVSTSETSNCGVSFDNTNFHQEIAKTTEDTSVTIYAKAASDWTFGGWYSDSALTQQVSENPTATVSIGLDSKYYAKFTKTPYLRLDKESLIFEAAGGTQTVHVESNVNWSVS